LAEERWASEFLEGLAFVDFLQWFRARRDSDEALVALVNSRSRWFGSFVAHTRQMWRPLLLLSAATEMMKPWDSLSVRDLHRAFFNYGSVLGEVRAMLRVDVWRLCRKTWNDPQGVLYKICRELRQTLQWEHRLVFDLFGELDVRMVAALSPSNVRTALQRICVLNADSVRVGQIGAAVQQGEAELGNNGSVHFLALLDFIERRAEDFGGAFALTGATAHNMYYTVLSTPLEDRILHQVDLFTALTAIDCYLEVLRDVIHWVTARELKADYIDAQNIPPL
jgi:hypothetical protein